MKNLIAVIKEREKAKKAEELRLRLEAEKAKKEGEEMRGGMGRPGMNITPEMMQRFQNMRGGQQVVSQALSQRWTAKAANSVSQTAGWPAGAD